MINQTIIRARNIVAHCHKQADKYKVEGYPVLARENRKECEVVKGLLDIIDRSLWRKVLDWFKEET